MNSPKRRTRRRLRFTQFSMGTLVLLVSLAAVFLGVRAREANAIRHAIRHVERLGGTVWFEDECDEFGQPLVSFPADDRYEKRRPTDALIFVNLLIRDVACVDLRMTTIDDHDIVALRAFQHLRRLHLDHTAITDRGLASMLQFRELKFIGLEGTEVTESGVVKLQSMMPELKTNRSFEFDRILEMFEQIPTQDDRDLSEQLRIDS